MSQYETVYVVYDEPQNAFMAYCMIASYAALCGYKWRKWEELTPEERQYYIAGVKDLDQWVRFHAEPSAEDIAEAEALGQEINKLADVNVWYRRSWRMFPWGEPEPLNLPHIHHEFVLSVASFLIAMAGHYSTAIPQTEEV